MRENKSERIAAKLMAEGFTLSKQQIDMMFTRAEKNDKVAFMFLDQFAPNEIRAAWQAYAPTMLRYRAPTLQRLYKIMKAQ